MTDQPPKKKRHVLRTLILLAIGGALLLCVIIAISTGGDKQATAPTPAPAQVAKAEATAVPAAKPTAKPTEAPTAMPGIGDRAESAGIALTVTSVERSKGSSIFQPEAGKTYLVAEVLIENVSRDETPYNLMYFAVKDADAYEYKTAMWSPDPRLLSGTLPKGDRVRGTVAFEVPESAGGFVLSYEPLVLLGGYKTIRIAIGD